MVEHQPVASFDVPVPILGRITCIVDKGRSFLSDRGCWADDGELHAIVGPVELFFTPRHLL